MSLVEKRYTRHRYDHGLNAFEFPIGARTVRFYGIFDELSKTWTLIDCGLAGHPVEVLESGDLEGTVARIIVTHADADHIGGVAEVVERFPGCEVLCHEFDRAWCEDHDLLVAERYGCAQASYGFSYPEPTRIAFREACGDNFAVTRSLRAGDLLRLGKLNWRILHVPGHSPGHIALYSESKGWLVGGDCVLGGGPPSADGLPSMPPTHQFIGDYVSTLELIRSLELTTAYFAHWRPLNNVDLLDLIEKSRLVIAEDLEWLQKKRGDKASFESLLAGLNARGNTWDPSENAHYQYALVGYLDYLQQHGYEWKVYNL